MESRYDLMNDYLARYKSLEPVYTAGDLKAALTLAAGYIEECSGKSELTKEQFESLKVIVGATADVVKFFGGDTAALEEVLAGIQVKNAPGLHDQSSHGVWAAQFATTGFKLSAQAKIKLVSAVQSVRTTLGNINNKFESAGVPLKDLVSEFVANTAGELDPGLSSVTVMAALAAMNYLIVQVQVMQLRSAMGMVG
jgi:hypothetical protein